MLSTIEHLVIIVLLIAIAVWGAEQICRRFQLPAPVLWIVGAVLLITLLVFVLSQTGVYPIR